MRHEPEASAFLWDALRFARNVVVAVGETSLEAYLHGGPIAWATERQMELVGESLNNLRRVSPETADQIPDLHRIIGMRNVLVHGYAELNSEIVWLAATRSVPALIPVLERLLGGAKSE